MADTTASNGPVLAADGRPLKKSLARALRVQKMRALMLISPLLKLRGAKDAEFKSLLDIDGGCTAH